MEAGSTLQLGGTFALYNGSVFTGSGKALLSGQIAVDSIFDVSGSTEVDAGQTKFNLGAVLNNFGNPFIGAWPITSLGVWREF
jgi:hypothetical protein